jgi:4-amino-4-deoxy-L-arabinose transferase-like glycosyltransferase
MPRRRILLVLLVFSVLISPWRRELFVGDETKYAQVIREMRTTGAFFLPTLNGQPFTHKPPLHFWLIDLLTYPFGIYSLWPFVIPSIAAFAALLWLMTRIRGPLAAFVCGTSLMMWGSAQTARMDVGFTLFLTLGCWLLYRFFEHDDRRALAIAGFALGIATLIKGPMAPVIAIVLFAFESWRRRRVPRANDLPALAAMIVLPLLWFVPALLLGGKAYAHDVIVKQTVGRAFATWVHKAPPWYYLLHAPGDLAPWFFLAVVAIAIAAKRGNALDLFAVNWILAVLVPYSLMSSKLDVYMMAMIPPVAIVIGGLTEDDRAAVMANRITLVLLLAGAVYGFLRVPALYATPAVRGLFIVLGIASLIALFARGVASSTIALGSVVLAACAYLAIALIPLANQMASTTPLIAALQRQNVAPRDMLLYATPYLWSRDMPRTLEQVRYGGPVGGQAPPPVLIVSARKDAPNLGAALLGCRPVETVQMIGKPFDVYRCR